VLLLLIKLSNSSCYQWHYTTMLHYLNSLTVSYYQGFIIALKKQVLGFEKSLKKTSKVQMLAYLKVIYYYCAFYNTNHV